MVSLLLAPAVACLSAVVGVKGCFWRSCFFWRSYLFGIPAIASSIPGDPGVPTVASVPDDPGVPILYPVSGEYEP